MNRFRAVLLSLVWATSWATASAATNDAALVPRLPQQHPYLALTPADIARAKDRAARFPWAKRTLDALLEEANRITAKPLDALPAKGDHAHWNVSQRLVTAALASAFSGNRRQAGWARDGLLKYAEIYPRLPLTRGRCRVFSEASLYEAMWLVPLVQAYDLVADSGVFSEAQRTLVERDLLRAAVACFKVDDYERDPRSSDLHYRCYNFQAWHLSAVGLVGLALRDATLVDYAVNSRYGFRHLIAHDIRDDGLFWERSPGYHRFVLSALLPFTEAMARCGVDLYQLQVPNDRARDEGAHYVTDTSDQPKSLRFMFEAPFYLAFPDLSHIALGDSDRGRESASWLHLVAWNRYRDPKLAWLLRRDVPISAIDTNRGRAGFLHYYRYLYRYDNVRLDGRPVVWDRRDATFEPQGESMQVSDGGKSQPDHYLLNGTDLGDFTLEWTLTRLADSGPQDRAWVVFHTGAKTVANRKSFPLMGHVMGVNQPTRFRLEVAGERTILFCEGKQVASSPTRYHYAPEWQWLVYDSPEADSDFSLPIRFANTGIFENGCSLFPSSGVAVLRQTAGDFTARPEATAIALSYGPYGGGHGHPDKLSLALYAHGRQWIPQFGSMPYETRWKTEWTSQTLSHNTVVVDGVSQKPTGERNLMWPVDSAANKVLGTLERFDAPNKLVAAACDRAYEGFKLTRAERLCGNCVVDVFDVTPARPDPKSAAHQFDFVLHIDGELAGSTAPLTTRGGKLGQRCGYQLVEQKQGANLAGVAALTFASGAHQLRIWIVPADPGPVEAIVADGLTSSPEVKMPMVVVRRHGASARFITVLEPVEAANPLRAVRLERGQLLLERAKGTERVQAVTGAASQ